MCRRSLARGLVDAERLEVVARDDGARPVGPAKQRTAGRDPLVDVERAVADEARIDAYPCLVHRGSEPVHAGPAAQDVRGAADDGDPAVAKAQQVAGRGQAAVPVRRADRRRGMERLAGRIEDDERDAPRAELLPHRRAQVREDGDDTGRSPREDAFDPASPGRPPTLHLGQHDRQVVAPGDPLDTADDLERPLGLELVEDHFDQG